MTMTMMTIRAILSGEKFPGLAAPGDGEAHDILPAIEELSNALLGLDLVMDASLKG